MVIANARDARLNDNGAMQTLTAVGNVDRMQTLDGRSVFLRPHDKIDRVTSRIYHRGTNNAGVRLECIASGATRSSRQNPGGRIDITNAPERRRRRGIIG